IRPQPRLAPVPDERGLRSGPASQAMTLKLGWKASAEQFGPQELLDLAVLAEEKGVDSIWVSDHYQPFKHPDGHSRSPLPRRGASGRKTSSPSRASTTGPRM